MAALPGRFEDPLARALFGAWFLALILLLAIDLDQRLMPDELTLPVIPIGLLYAISGLNPLVGPELGPAILGAIVIPAALYLPSIPFGAGAFGLGDVKLLAGLGLVVGLERAFSGVVWGLFVGGAVILGLLVARRIGRRSYVPFGPFLVAGALWAALGPGLG
jgi:leader peptidase (prepilin peptidase)/N-methyltransferase